VDKEKRGPVARRVPLCDCIRGFICEFVGLNVSSWTRRKEDLRRAIKGVDKRELPSCMWVRGFKCEFVDKEKRGPAKGDKRCR